MGTNIPGDVHFEEAALPSLENSVSADSKDSRDSVDFNVSGESGDSDASAAIREKFRRVLEKMQLTKPERTELEARIERRLVLSEAQLDLNSVRNEKLEARGLDYTGKSIIAKQAIETGSRLEVSWPGSGGAVNRIIGIPRVLEKKERESILVLKPLSPEEGEGGGIPEDSANAEAFHSIQGNLIRIPLGKISLLRRIKHSVFGE